MNHMMIPSTPNNAGNRVSESKQIYHNASNDKFHSPEAELDLADNDSPDHSSIKQSTEHGSEMKST